MKINNEIAKLFKDTALKIAFRKQDTSQTMKKIHEQTNTAQVAAPERTALTARPSAPST
jgi:hypothetical protein